jgi:hypothetical protein
LTARISCTCASETGRAAGSEDAGVVDQHVDFAERGDEFSGCRRDREVVDDVARFLVQREDAEAALLEERGSRFADALRGAGDEDVFSQDRAC